MAPPPAAIAHLGLLTPLLLAGFAAGVYGHMARSRVLVLVGIGVIAVISLYVVAGGDL